MLRNAVRMGVSDFPEKRVTNMYGSMTMLFITNISVTSG